jgi:hypothetical protein
LKEHNESAKEDNENAIYDDLETQLLQASYVSDEIPRIFVKYYPNCVSIL